MSPEPHARYASASLDPAAKQLLYHFDQAWQAGQPPSLEQVLLSNSAGKGRRALLEELVRIDLGWRWRHAAHGRSSGTDSLPVRPRLEDYVQRYPELGPLDQLSAELIGEEYWVRRRAGEHASHEEYLARF